MPYVALDIGGTFIKYALMEADASLLKKGKEPTPGSWEAFLKTVDALIRRFGSEAEGICVSCPGLIDVNSGIVYHGGSLHFLHERNLKQELHKRSGLPVEIENDAKCAGLAEAVLGNASHVRDSITIVLGTGIGGALVKDGKIIHGHHLMAGEFSWVIPNIDMSGETPPRKQALLFHRVSTQSLIDKAAVRLNIPPKDITGELVYRWAEQGDGACREVIQEFYRGLAIQIANLQHIFDPEIFCIGGGISREPALLPEIRRHIDIVYSEYGLVMAKPEVVLCKFKNDANLIGALCHYQQYQSLSKGVNVQ